MKFFQKRGVAIVVLILAIVASSAWGLHKAPAITTPTGGEKVDTSLSTAAFEQYVRDDADILSDKTEKAVSLYNANWDKMFGSIMAVVTTESANDIENAAYDYAIEMQLAENDAILVIAKQQQDYYLLASGNFYDLLSGLSQSFVASCMESGVQKSDYDAAVQELCSRLHVELSQQYQQDQTAQDDAGTAVLFIMLLVLLFLIWIWLDRMRYNRYRRRYMMPGMGVPTVMYHPIFWGRRPPRGPRPPRSGGPRPPQGGPRPALIAAAPPAVIAARPSRRDGPRAVPVIPSADSAAAAAEAALAAETSVASAAAAAVAASAEAAASAALAAAAAVDLAEVAAADLAVAAEAASAEDAEKPKPLTQNGKARLLGRRAFSYFDCGLKGDDRLACTAL